MSEAAAGTNELPGLHNLRDLGGFDVVGGGRVRDGVLYRAAGLHAVAGEGLAALAGLGLRTVFDLRSPGELGRFGEFAADGTVARFRAPMLPRTWQAGDEAGPAAEMLGRRYATMLESGREAVRTVVERLGEPEALPAAFFCAAGKDRTGVMAAVVLGLLEVPDAEIVADYALSEANMPALMAWIEANEPGTSEWIASLPPGLLEAPAAAMESLLETLRERHGDVAGYVRWCGASDSSIAAVRGALVG